MKYKHEPTVLSIAGSDSSGGAGIQADIRTITAHGCHAATAITALTAQNTQGVQAIMEVPPEFLEQQIESVFAGSDINAVKIGMLYSPDIVNSVVAQLKRYRTKKAQSKTSPQANIVFDPVMVATSGSVLSTRSLSPHDFFELMQLSILVTPNIPEAEFFTDKKIMTIDDMVTSAEQISEAYQCNVLLKGGHLNTEEAVDVYYSYALKTHKLYGSPRVQLAPTHATFAHGTGCKLSSAIACYLARGHELVDAIGAAKVFLTKLLMSGIDTLKS